jgi:hypothetical protein
MAKPLFKYEALVSQEMAKPSFTYEDLASQIIIIITIINKGEVSLNLQLKRKAQQLSK